MSYAPEALSALTQLTPDISSNDDHSLMKSQDQTFQDLISTTFKNFTDNNVQYKSLINTLSQSPQFTSDPQHLLMLQSYIGEYTNYISLVTSLTRKGISTIETLEKSQ